MSLSHTNTKNMNDKHVQKKPSIRNQLMEINRNIKRKVKLKL